MSWSDEAALSKALQQVLLLTAALASLVSLVSLVSLPFTRSS